MAMNLSEKYRPLYAPEDGGGGGGAGASSGSPPPSAPATSAPSSPSSAAPSGPSPSAPADSGTPSPAPSTAPGSKSAGEVFDFGAMFEAPDNLAGALSAPATAPPAQPAAPQPGPPQEVPPTPAPPTGAEAGQAPATDAGAAAGQPAAQAAPDQSTPQPAADAAGYIDPYDPAALAHHLSQFEGDATNLVAERMFQLTPEEKEALEQDVIGTVPKLLAKVFVKSQQNVLLQLGRMIPMMMQRHLAANQRNTSNEDKFYTRWPDIKRDKHHDNVVKYAAVYRQMHPQATLEQMIEDLGPMIMMAHKIVPSMSGQPQAGPGRQTGTPATTANGRGPQPSPFVPAGAGPAVSHKPAEVEAWEAMFRQQE